MMKRISTVLRPANGSCGGQEPHINLLCETLIQIEIGDDEQGVRNSI